MDKLPPIEKIYEAYSAIADKRVGISSNTAEVFSSSNDKLYYVQWDGNTYKSNDSATYWQGYAGYPIIAVLMLQGKLSLNETVAAHFKGINWTKVNKEYKANYAEAVSTILHTLKADGVEIDSIQSEVNKVFEEIKDLTIQIKRGRKKPEE